jgi:hypothetical protein
MRQAALHNEIGLAVPLPLVEQAQFPDTYEPGSDPGPVHLRVKDFWELRGG